MERNVFWVCFCWMAVLAFSSCSKENGAGNGATGTFLLSLQADDEVIVGNGGASRAEAGNGNSPDMDSFSVAVNKEEEILYEWATYAEMKEDDEPELRPSVYTAKAWWGDLSSEGFDSPCYAGSTDFTVRQGESTPVNIVCTLANAQLTVDYTDKFKDFFDTYSASVSTSLGNVVTYGQTDEGRFAYFSPGKLTVNVSVKKAGQASAAVYKVKEIDAEARHAYTLTLDVDAGSATMKVSFSEKVSQEEQVEFPVTDEALNAPAPYFKAQGFESEKNISMVEGNVSDQKIYAYINAVGGIKGCKMTTVSALTGDGFPSEVDLANPEGYAAVLKKYGLVLKGFSGNKGQMAMVDFTEFLSGLPVGEHTFTLSDATDSYGKTSAEEKLVLKADVSQCPFTVEATDGKLDFLSQECKVKLTYQTSSPTYKGNPAKVHYYIAGESGDTDLTYVSADTINNKEFIVTLQTPSAIKEPFEVAAALSKVVETARIDVKCGITVDSEGDVWAKKVVFHLFNAACNDIYIQYQDGSEWKDAGDIVQKADYQPGVGTLAAVHGLPSNTTFRFKALMREGTEVSNEVKVTTEEELQVPNSGFEDWHTEKVYSHSSYVMGLGAGIDIYQWFPYTSTAYWDTRNDLTNSQKSGTTCYYTSCSGTISTTDSYSGLAAEISSLGWGEGNTYLNSMTGVTIKNKTAGMLFMGDYDMNGSDGVHELYGQPFASRPSSFSFYYKFKPIVNDNTGENESFKAYMVIENRENGAVELGRGELISNQQKDSFGELVTIPITYTRFDLKATHAYIVFISSIVDSPSVGLATGSYNALKGFSDSKYQGNVLIVDELKINY